MNDTTFRGIASTVDTVVIVGGETLDPDAGRNIRFDRRPHKDKIDNKIVAPEYGPSPVGAFVGAFLREEFRRALSRTGLTDDAFCKARETNEADEK